MSDELQQIKDLSEFNSSNKGQKFDLSGLQCFAKCVGCYDGDTVTLTFPFANEHYYSSCRCMGYNTAEIRTKDPEEKRKGLEARDLLRDLILDSIVYVKFGPNDKYGRPLATIYTVRTKKSGIRRKQKIMVGECIKDVLIKAGLAAEYYGKGEKKY